MKITAKHILAIEAGRAFGIPPKLVSNAQLGVMLGVGIQMAEENLKHAEEHGFKNAAKKLKTTAEFNRVFAKSAFQKIGDIALSQPGEEMYEKAYLWSVANKSITREQMIMFDADGGVFGEMDKVFQKAMEMIKIHDIDTASLYATVGVVAVLAGLEYAAAEEVTRMYIEKLFN